MVMNLILFYLLPPLIAASPAGVMHVHKSCNEKMNIIWMAMHGKHQACIKE